MNWTKDKPLVSGYYWLAWNEQAQIVQAWGFQNDPPDAVYFMGNDCGIEMRDLTNAFWLGPLIQPEITDHGW